MEAMLKDMLTNALNAWLVDKMINGKGSGEPLGIINTTGVMGLEIDKESGQTADTIILNNVLDIKSRCFRTRQPNLRWITNYDCEPELRKLHMVIGASGAPVYGFSSGNQPFDNLMGIPVVYTEFAQKLGDKGDFMLVDPSAYFRAYLTTAPIFDTSTHVYFVYDQTAIK
jgi:HK97 family phage major capsid protein